MYWLCHGSILYSKSSNKSFEIECMSCELSHIFFCIFYRKRMKNEEVNVLLRFDGLQCYFSAWVHLDVVFAGQCGRARCGYPGKRPLHFASSLARWCSLRLAKNANLLPTWKSSCGKPTSSQDRLLYQVLLYTYIFRNVYLPRQHLLFILLYHDYMNVFRKSIFENEVRLHWMTFNKHAPNVQVSAIINKVYC